MRKGWREGKQAMQGLCGSNEGVFISSQVQWKATETQYMKACICEVGGWG